MDIAEYKKLVMTLRPKLLGVALRITKKKEDAEDVVQEVFLRIWHQRKTIEKLKNLEAYSITMTKNLSIDKTRSKRYSLTDDALSNEADERGLPDKLLEQKDRAIAIKEMIGALPPLQREILNFKDVEGYETEEICNLTGIAAEAVRNNLSRARKKLRELYLQYQKTCGCGTV